MRGKLSHGLVEETADRIIPASAGQTGELCWLLLVAPDHPRECGANLGISAYDSQGNGSSPRVRGKPHEDLACGQIIRIIPASAGQTRVGSIIDRAPADHPRECGANADETTPDYSDVGSSPRVRGKQSQARHGTAAHRIIPASAGQTGMSPNVTVWHSDHPRECGANHLDPALFIPPQGSSPRVRGKPSPICRTECAPRIIPASAGQTSRKPERNASWEDHPRECGANRLDGHDVDPRRGSSPRVRGKHRRRDAHMLLVRIIPASAGQTRSADSARSVSQDHPRECGANGQSGVAESRQGGSSPRVRGKLHRASNTGEEVRIIPASAGQTRSRPATAMAFPDHPRECGANPSPRCPAAHPSGSSPRVRGKPLVEVVRAPVGGIIPASAGQTHPQQ